MKMLFKNHLIIAKYQNKFYRKKFNKNDKLNNNLMA